MNIIGKCMFGHPCLGCVALGVALLLRQYMMLIKGRYIRSPGEKYTKQTQQVRNVNLGSHKVAS